MCFLKCFGNVSWVQERHADSVKSCFICIVSVRNQPMSEIPLIVAVVGVSFSVTGIQITDTFVLYVAAASVSSVCWNTRTSGPVSFSESEMQSVNCYIMIHSVVFLIRLHCSA